jgi:hypothetical protein
LADQEIALPPNELDAGLRVISIIEGGKRSFFRQNVDLPWFTMFAPLRDYGCVSH